MNIKNRFVMSAAADNLENDQEKQINRFASLASGGIGLIISGGMRVHNIDSWDKIVETTHNNDGKVAIQLVTERGPGVGPWSKPREDAIAVSALSDENPFFNFLTQYGKHHAATENEIEDIINTYGKAAAKAKLIGADAIQIHAAHQSFPSQFLSPLTNKRTDKWGGSLENRTRFHGEIYKTVRAVVGDDFPIIIKLGVQDFLKGGLEFSEGRIAAKIIAECGYDAIEISQGLQDIESAFKLGNSHGIPMRTGINKITDEAYFRPWCQEIKKLVTKPIIMSGGIRSYELIEEILNKNDADLVGLCRPFIREPGLINRWQKGNLHKATCVSCNKCVTELLIKGLPLECYLDLSKK